MAVWYCSSTAYSAVAQWAASHSYTVGNIVRQLASPAVGNERCFIVTTAGTSGSSEPSWTLTAGGSTTDSGVTWHECTGQSADGWGAASPRIPNLLASGWAVAGDTIYVSSDHAETSAAQITITAPSTTITSAPVSVISVNRAGSVPPVAVDVLAGASATTTGANSILIAGNIYVQGVTFNCGTGSGGAGISIPNTGSPYFMEFFNCGFNLLSTAAGNQIAPEVGAGRILWDNCTVSFSNAGHTILANNSGIFEWRNTASAIQGSTFPTNLFTTISAPTILCNGLDLSALGSGQTLIDCNSGGLSATILNCKLGAGVTLSTGVRSNSNNNYNVAVDLIDCNSGATNEWDRAQGAVYSNATYTHTGGAPASLQPVSASSFVANPLELTPIYQWNALTGSSHTATVELMVPGYGLAFNPSDAATGMVFSNNNQFASPGTAPSGYAGVRSVGSYSSGKYYFEATVDTMANAGFIWLGIANSAASLTSTPTSTNAELWNGSGSTSSGLTMPAYTVGSILGFAVDLTNNKIWYRLNGGNWNNDVIANQNPATNTGGVSLSAITFPMFVYFMSYNGITATATVNTGGPFAAAAPAGFSPFGTATAAPLNNNDCWLEFEYLGSSITPIGSLVTSLPATILTTPTAIPSSAATWTTTGLVSPTTQKLQVTFTPQMVGLVRGVVKVAKPSTTLYVDPLITIV